MLEKLLTHQDLFTKLTGHIIIWENGSAKNVQM